MLHSQLSRFDNYYMPEQHMYILAIFVVDDLITAQAEPLVHQQPKRFSFFQAHWHLFSDRLQPAGLYSAGQQTEFYFL